jgi:tetratricopeptide (TPR) repeat protein
MKKITFISFLLIAVLAFGTGLPAYVAQFDKDLAIQLYEDELTHSDNIGETYQALADLYNNTGEIGLAEDCYRHLIMIHKSSDNIYKTYLNFLYENSSYNQVRTILREKSLDQEWGRLFMAKSYFKEGKFDSTLVFSKGLPEINVGQLQRLSLEGLEIKYRSPALGGIMSAIIPGSGKMYAGRLLDGIQAFSIVAAPAYNAYYHFAKNGNTSVRAWIWTAVASWFYISDIYGSIKAVHEYNEMQKFKIIERYEP